MLNFTQFLSLSRFPFSIQIYANGTQNKTGSIRAVQKQIHRELACKRSRAWISSPFVVAYCFQTPTAASLYAYKMHGFVIQKYRKQFFPLKKKQTYRAPSMENRNAISIESRVWTKNPRNRSHIFHLSLTDVNDSRQKSFPYEGIYVQWINTRLILKMKPRWQIDANMQNIFMTVTPLYHKLIWCIYNI